MYDSRFHIHQFRVGLGFKRHKAETLLGLNLDMFYPKPLIRYSIQNPLTRYPTQNIIEVDPKMSVYDNDVLYGCSVR